MKAERPEVKPNGRYSVNEAAKCIGFSRHRLYAVMRQGRIPFGVFIANNRRYILGKDILRYWEQNI